jgi:hypothetical protein
MDPYAFGTPVSGSGSVSQRYGSGSGSARTKLEGSGARTIGQRHGSADPDPYQNVTG